MGHGGKAIGSGFDCRLRRGVGFVAGVEQTLGVGLVPGVEGLLPPGFGVVAPVEAAPSGQSEWVLHNRVDYEAQGEWLPSRSQVSGN